MPLRHSLLQVSISVAWVQISLAVHVGLPTRQHCQDLASTCTAISTLRVAQSKRALQQHLESIKSRPTTSISIVIKEEEEEEEVLQRAASSCVLDVHSHHSPLQIWLNEMLPVRTRSNVVPSERNSSTWCQTRTKSFQILTSRALMPAVLRECVSLPKEIPRSPETIGCAASTE